jgi:hypothetical protein
MKLGLDEARLLLHERRIGPPRVAAGRADRRGTPGLRRGDALAGPWINDLADGLSVKDIETVQRVITVLRRKLEGPDDAAVAGRGNSKRR